MKIFTVDAFTGEHFRGNPAAVCILSEERDARWMQLVAREMNLSETAFLKKVKDIYALRWFTPLVESKLCGHATLASAHILWEAGYENVKDEIFFDTRSGRLSAIKKREWIELDFPAEPPEEVEPPEAILKALGVKPLYTGKNRFDYIIEVESGDNVMSIEPDFKMLSQATERGVIVTSISDMKGYDFISRFFAPAVGIDEDPVTGSAHCCLGPYWSKRLGKSELSGYQASERGGVLRVGVGKERVRIAGMAITVIKGELLA
ncbi:MAG: PhzF family phenazine biosynthesis protein [Spirochaetota bacterium]